MKIFGLTINWGAKQQPAEPVKAPHYELQSAMLYGDDMMVASPWTAVNYRSFNGEKTPGELGNPTVLIPDYRNLRIRAHQANFSNVVVKIITRRYFSWIVGAGLKLQAQPNRKVLELENIKEDFKEFKNNVESYWSVFSNSTNADYAGMHTLDELEADAYSSAFLGGDCLVILRVNENYDLKVQVIDGQHVVTPFLNAEFIDKAKERGNIILHGIEFDKKGKHVAYYVLTRSIDNPLGVFERVEAVEEKTGCLMAWMIYADKQRIDHKRGIPRIASILEMVAKLDRYTEATVSSAEERQKLPWVIQHDKYSDGENPVLANIRRNTGTEAGDMGSYELGKLAAKNIAATENKTVYNLPIGAKFTTVNSTAEINYDPFFNAVLNQICAPMDMPPEVALQKYNSNYSASRAAINSWGYLVNLGRKKHGNDFKQKIYKVWLYIHVLRNKVDAKGYIKAINEKNWLVIESYSAARWTGVNMPHIDPLKEANAQRVMLGDLTTPLITYDQVTEQLNNGDFEEVINQVIEERKIIPPPMAPPESPVATLKGDNVDDKPATPATKPQKGKQAINARPSFDPVLEQALMSLQMQLNQMQSQLEEVLQ